MQVNDIRKKSVGQIVWLQITFKVRIFYRAQFILVTITKRHVSQRPFELEPNVRYFWNPENDCVQLVYFLSF